jgi:hypothetical protein
LANAFVTAIGLSASLWVTAVPSIQFYRRREFSSFEQLSITTAAVCLFWGFARLSGLELTTSLPEMRWPVLDHCADTNLLLRYPSTMRSQFSKIGLLGVTLLAPSSFLPQQATTRPVTIEVSDQVGGHIAHAQIRLVPAPGLAPTKLETDERGNLLLNLKAGGYALFVSAQGFKSESQHIDVATPDDEARAIQVYPVVLQIGATGSPSPTIYPKDSLVLTDDPYHAPVALSPADFRALPHITITVHNGHTNADETYSGVRLATLLAIVNAPIGNEFHEEALTSYLIASGSDGYSVLLSLAEIDPSFHDGQVLVADARDGQPLAKSGPFQLIVSEDRRRTRWVRNLDSIALQGVR